MFNSYILKIDTKQLSVDDFDNGRITYEDILNLIISCTGNPHNEDANNLWCDLKFFINELSPKLNEVILPELLLTSNFTGFKTYLYPSGTLIRINIKKKTVGEIENFYYRVLPENQLLEGHMCDDIENTDAVLILKIENMSDTSFFASHTLIKYV